MKKYTLSSVRAQMGFTLIELLLVIVIISTLAVTVFVALNPAARLRDSRDAVRTTDVANILSAIHTYIVDNAGALPTGLSNGMSEMQIGTAASGCAVATAGCAVTTAACVDLATPLASYLKTMPLDPSAGTAAETNYAVNVDANGIVTVKACGTEGASNISASR